jgi:adenylate kinase family enzyme
MQRIVVIGNSGGGKSTLARKLAARRGLPYAEIDALLWQPNWELTPADVYEAEHGRLIAAESWIADGLGSLASIPPRLSRATEIVLIDMPFWQHCWLAAERQIAWATGRIDHPPAGLTEMPPTEAVFQNLWAVERDWMPAVRRLVDEEQAAGKRVHRIASVDALREAMESL